MMCIVLSRWFGIFSGGNIYALVYYSDAYTKTPKMHPSQLDVFKTVKEITGKTLQNWHNLGLTKDFGNE